MQAFGREVASRTLAGVLSGLILLALAAGWKFIAPTLALLLNIPVREAFAWFFAATSLTVAAVALWFLSRKPAPPTPAKPATLTLTPNNSAKPSVTLTHHGAATTYRADGRIVSHVDGTQSTHPTVFRCELQVGGRVRGWDVTLQDGDWANIILGSLEDVLPASSKGLSAVEAWTPAGKCLVVRRGKMGEHVRVPDTGALVELTIRATPPLAEPIGPRLFRVVRNGDVVTVTHA